MKKIFMLLTACLMALPMSIFAQSIVLIDKEWTCANDWTSGSQLIDSSVLTNLAEDDKLEVNVTAVNAPSSSWPQVFISYVDKDGNWLNFLDSDPHSDGLWNVTELPHTAIITFTKTMVDDIKAGKYMVIAGAGYTADKATWIHYAPLPAGTLWQGEKVMPSSWGAWLNLPGSKFADCKVGDMLRLTTKDVGAGAQAQLSSASWTSLASKSFGGKYVDFELTEDLLTELQKNGVNINGCSYTLTSVKYYDPANVVSYPKEINITQKDWTWTDSKPVIGIKVSNPTSEAVTLSTELELSTDKGEAVKTYTQNIELAANETGKEVSFTLSDIENPGIYRFTAYVNDEAVEYTRSDKAYKWTSLNIAYQPEKISSPADAQSDFTEYWNGVKAQLKTIPVDAQLELVQEGTYRNLYKVTLNSIPNGTSGDPVQIRGYYAEPKREGKYPCIVYFQGYDSDDTSEVWHPTADSNHDYAELIISPRGQSFGNRGEYKSDNIYCNTTSTNTDDNMAGYKWFTYHFGDKDSYYYRGAYMDQVRGIDFVCSREKIDTNNIFCTGGSQGGAFTLVATALSDGRVNAIAPAIPFMGDFPDYFLVGTWPAYEAKNAAGWKNMTDDDMYKFLSYYDTKNFASMITAPTLESIGLQDNVCPAHTNLAPYNLITCEKILYVNKNLVHEVPYGTSNGSDYNWNTLTSNWWKSHKKDTSGISNIQNNLTGTHKYMRNGQVVIVKGNNTYNIIGQQMK